MTNGSRQRSENFLTRWLSRRKERIAAQRQELAAIEGPYFSGRLPFVLLMVLGLLGAFATGFLTYRHVLLASTSGAVKESFLCRAEGSVNCDAILLTEYSVLFGYFPSATLGLMGFAFVLWFIVNGLVNERARKVSWTLLILYFVAAIGFSWYYAYIMAFHVDFVCTWCIVVHVVNLLSLVIVLAVAIKHRKRFLLPELSTRAERVYLVAGGLLLSALVFTGATYWESRLSFKEAKHQFEELANDPVVIRAVMEGSPDFNIPIQPADPVYGSPKAPYPIILFSDFKCPVCARREKFLRNLVDKNPNTLRLVFINYPLSKECNPAVLHDLHPGACTLARAAYAAFLLGGSKAFWTYGSLLLENRKNLTPGTPLALAERLNLDTAGFLDLMKPDSPAAKKVEQDVHLGIELSLTSTPQVFFLGKRIPEMFQGEFLVEALEGLIASKHPEDTDIDLRW
ncbi:MAG: vitamin K epoxide reductase family protein [Desulfomonilaceae bacterium]|nr:vitamin K epoxide reductase family protein [Desulfomonilaceae bacterium]